MNDIISEIHGIISGKSIGIILVQTSYPDQFFLLFIYIAIMRKIMDEERTRMRLTILLSRQFSYNKDRSLS